MTERRGTAKHVLVNDIAAGVRSGQSLNEAIEWAHAAHPSATLRDMSEAAKEAEGYKVRPTHVSPFIKVVNAIRRHRKRTGDTWERAARHVWDTWPELSSHQIWNALVKARRS